MSREYKITWDGSDTVGNLQTSRRVHRFDRLGGTEQPPLICMPDTQQVNLEIGFTPLEYSRYEYLLRILSIISAEVVGIMGAAEGLMGVEGLMEADQ